MQTISSITRHLLNFAMIAELRERSLLKISLLEDFGDLDYSDINSRFPVLSSVITPSSWDKACELAEYQVTKSKRLGIRIISHLDKDYPSLLKDSNDYPCILWVQGSLLPNNKSIAIIGPREPTKHGEIITERITKYVIEQEWGVVSGLALGIDAIAHETALSNGGKTIAIMAHGLQMTSPSANKDLAKRILANGGGLISEYPIGMKPLAHQFVKRDRIQAALSQGVVMIQSDLNGGSLHAPRAALDYNRWVAIPYPTKKDIAEKATKIEANLLIAHGSKDDKQKLLKCSAEALNQIIIINSRDDYPLLLDDSTVFKANSPPYQSPLI